MSPPSFRPYRSARSHSFLQRERSGFPILSEPFSDRTIQTTCFHTSSASTAFIIRLGSIHPTIGHLSSATLFSSYKRPATFHLSLRLLRHYASQERHFGDFFMNGCNGKCNMGDFILHSDSNTWEFTLPCIKRVMRYVSANVLNCRNISIGGNGGKLGERSICLHKGRFNALFLLPLQRN